MFHDDSASRPVYIYALLEPNTTEVRYVGKVLQRRNETVAMSMQRRLLDHMYESSIKDGCHRLHWLRCLQQQGQRPDVMLLDIGSSQTWAGLERFYITALRGAGFRLVNSTEGGDGMPGHAHSLDTRARLSAVARARVATVEGRAHLRVMSEAARLIPAQWTPQMRASLSAARMGNQYARGAVRSPQTRARIAAGLSGRAFSAEHRAHLSEAQKRRQARVHAALEGALLAQQGGGADDG